MQRVRLPEVVTCSRKRFASNVAFPILTGSVRVAAAHEVEPIAARAGWCWLVSAERIRQSCQDQIPRFGCLCPIHRINSPAMYPDDSGKDLATVLSYMAGRRLSTEAIRKAMELPRSTYYSQLERGTLISADNLRKAAANLGINRAELLTRYRLIDPEEVRSLAEEIGGPPPLLFPPSRTGGTR